ncbi:MAG TPA: PHB depolymerase family esterase [Polyangiaceae bacterium]|jgi:polyhydroxybutyrate depolymerase|nr:PHB depolymerase family esterase [Polyangiaceae bacterium]
MSVRSRVGLLFLSLTAMSAAHCGSSSNGGSGAGATKVTSSDAGNCGTRTTMRGKTSRTLMVDGTARTYIAYLPKSLDATTASPFVFVTHGAEMDASEMYDITQYAALADSEGIAVAFLDGQNTSSSAGTMTLDPWNVSDNGAQVCGAGTFANNSTAGVDFAFMDAVKADIAQDQCVDSEHVFATGFSMGGYFTHHIGCDRTDIRAVAPHSGATIASLSACKTGHVPVIIFHGLSDPLIVPGCDDPNSAAQSGFPASATLWAQKNGCKDTYSTVPENGDGGGDGQCYVYDGCPADGQVELCTFAGMVHCWAGGSTAGGGGMFSCPTYTSATQLEWDFFKKYAW